MKVSWVIQKLFSLSYYISVNTGAMIGQFSRPHFTEVFPPPSIYTQRYTKYLINLLFRLYCKLQNLVLSADKSWSVTFIIDLKLVK